MLRRILTICGGLVLCVMAAVVTMGADPGTYGTAMKATTLAASAGDTMRLSGSHWVTISWDYPPTLIFAGSRMGTGDTDPSTYGRDTLSAAYLAKLGNSYTSPYFYDLDTLMVLAGPFGCTYAATISRNVIGGGVLAGPDKILARWVAGSFTLGAAAKTTITYAMLGDFRWYTVSSDEDLTCVLYGDSVGVAGIDTFIVRANGSDTEDVPACDSLRLEAGASGATGDWRVRR